MDFTAPSFLPDYRATTLARSWNMSTGWSVRETYYRGAPRKTGMQAHISESWIKAIPFDIFQDGIRRYSSHQGVFNDHRKNL